MTGGVDWAPLDAELARWQGEGLVLPIWWRDDDATAPSEALDRLVRLSRATGVPVHLAVIPEAARPELAQQVAGAHGRLIPLVHGWAHENHAPPEEKKAEFGAHRLPETALSDARRGLDRLQRLFGTALRPIFVPPWNRVSPQVTACLPALGYRCLSTFTPRAAVLAAPGLEQVNTHVDPIAWRGGRGLADPQMLVDKAARQLADRREGRADNTEPFGLLTHHLVHDAAIWDFIQAFLVRLTAGPVRVWTATHHLEEDKDEPT